MEEILERERCLILRVKTRTGVAVLKLEFSTKCPLPLILLRSEVGLLT
tara:strand:- start:1314 stop:1457 length:144 start_codon:yes stop_codon:yes gene_type:complete